MLCSSGVFEYMALTDPTQCLMRVENWPFKQELAVVIVFGCVVLHFTDLLEL